MAYKIISGKYETGKEEEKAGYQALFGQENIQYKFDLYFHFYNLVHEFGHCLLDMNQIKMDPVEEEMYVNRLAVSYWKYAGREDRIKELEEVLGGVLGNIPSPIPPEQSFEDFFKSIWGTEALNNVMLYGYFQLQSVLLVIRSAGTFDEVLKERGFEAELSAEPVRYDGEINAENGDKVLDNVITNFRKIGITPPEVTLELVDNPMVQCAE